MGTPDYSLLRYPHAARRRHRRLAAPLAALVSQDVLLLVFAPCPRRQRAAGAPRCGCRPQPVLPAGRRLSATILPIVVLFATGVLLDGAPVIEQAALVRQDRHPAG